MGATRFLLLNESAPPAPHHQPSRLGATSQKDAGRFAHHMVGNSGLEFLLASPSEWGSAVTFPVLFPKTEPPARSQRSFLCSPTMKSTGSNSRPRRS